MSNNKKIKDGSVKTFGFRSGKSYKMIPAILYYLFAASVVVMSVIGELTHYKFEAQDYILFVFKYVFITVLLFSPLIFLSDYNYVYKLPLFGRKEKTKSLIGMIVVFMICYFMWNIQIYATSDTYKKSVEKYTKQIEREAKERAKKMEKQTEKTTSKKGQTVYSHYDSDGNRVEEVINDNKGTKTVIVYDKKDNKVKSKKVVEYKETKKTDKKKTATPKDETKKKSSEAKKEENTKSSGDEKQATTTKKDSDFNDDKGWSKEN